MASDGIASIKVSPLPVVDHAMFTISGFKNMPARLILFNLKGKEAQILFEGKISKDNMRIPLNTRELDRGIYLYRLETEANVVQQKLIMLR